MTRWLRLGAALALSVSACAAPKKPPVPFVKTPAFKAIEGKAIGVLEEDVNGDGLPDVIVAEREAQGFVPVVYVQLVKDEVTEWRKHCVGPLVRGEDLDAFRFGVFGAARVLYMLALVEEPEELTQEVAVFDVTCATHAAVSVRLPKTDAQVVVAPETLRGGAALLDDGTLRVIDEPRYLALVGANGPVKVLTGVRERVFTAAPEGAAESARKLDLVRPVDLTVRLSQLALTPEQSALEGGDPTRLVSEPVTTPTGRIEELVDHNDATGVTWQAGEPALLGLKATPPMRLLEIHHGCGDDTQALLLEDGAGRTIVTGTQPPAGSFALAVGKAGTAAKAQRELLLLEEPKSELRLMIGPTDKLRCMRELVGYFLHDGSAPEETHEPGS